MSAPAALTVNEDGAVSVPISVTPFNSGDSVSVTITGIPSDVTLSDSGGSLTVSNGSVTLTAAQLAGLTLQAGEASSTLTVTATENSLTTSQTIAVTVTPVAEAPVVTVSDPVTVNEGATVALAITDIAADADDTLGVVTISGVAGDARRDRHHH